MPSGDCHGGYHCHRGKSDSDDWERTAAILGGLAVVGVVIWWWNNRRRAPTLTDLAPPAEERNTGLRYVIDEKGSYSVGAFWRVRF